MAKGARKVQRAQEQHSEGRAKSRRPSTEALAARPVEVPSPFSASNLKQLGFRLGLPLLAIWLIGLFVSSVSVSRTVKSISFGIPLALTLALVGALFYVLRQTKKARSVAGILEGAGSAEGRKAALEQLDQGFKKKDPTAIFARAQLLMQEDPRAALEVLETIDLGKVMAPVADEARGQRAMIHLMIGQPKAARDLADDIDLSRHQDAKTRAMLGSVVAEAWARTGQARKAVDTLALFNPDDPALEPVRPQLYRARAFAHAYTSDVKGMRAALKRLLEIDPRMLGGFLVKKAHPLLQKEAKQMLERSGAVPRKMVVQRR
jgi:hypothetical protein